MIQCGQSDKRVYGKVPTAIQGKTLMVHSGCSERALENTSVNSPRQSELAPAFRMTPLSCSSLLPITFPINCSAVPGSCEDYVKNYAEECIAFTYPSLYPQCQPCVLRHSAYLPFQAHRIYFQGIPDWSGTPLTSLQYPFQN